MYADGMKGSRERGCGLRECLPRSLPVPPTYTDEAIRFFTESCPHIKDYTAGYNDAEYITDMITEADRMGKGGDFVQAYAG